MAVLFIDLDGFKRINDTLGHSAGDELQCMAASRFKSLIRRPDTLACMGQLLLDSLAAPFQLQGHEVHVSPSIGVSFYPDDAAEPALLQAHADAAMYQAKASGRNCFRCYTAELNQQLTDRIVLEEDLRHAVDRGKIVLHYQPLYQADARLLGFEALVRWQHPVHAMISPERFIPIAEESKLIHDIGRWVLEQACGECVRHAVRARRMAGRGHCHRRFRHRLFVTAFLQRLPVDTLKIDQSFIRNLHLQRSGQGSMLIVEAIITLARGLGLKVLAEGVETKLQRDCLCQLGCDAMRCRVFISAGRYRPSSVGSCWRRSSPLH